MLDKQIPGECVILIPEECLLTAVAALRHMVRQPREYSASETSHAATLSCSAAGVN
jgi:hypothetical protein